MTTIIEDHGYPLIWFGKEDNVTEPRTEAGRAMLADVRASALPGSPSHDENIRYVLDIERQAATLALADVAGLDERLDLADELLDADHEIAAFLHGFIWPSFQHTTEPRDGDDCHECYAQAERLRDRIAAALKEGSR